MSGIQGVGFLRSLGISYMSWLSQHVFDFSHAGRNPQNAEQPTARSRNLEPLLGSIGLSDEGDMDDSQVPSEHKFAVPLSKP